jgi:aspartyl-tRNA(Asn)/glutamyl-tRNA(Gln) amidotransferase subunit C
MPPSWGVKKRYKLMPVALFFAATKPHLISTYAQDTPKLGALPYTRIKSAATMSLDALKIAKNANFARLALTPDEAERLRTQISGFFEIVDQMNAVDTQGVQPLAHPVAAMQSITLRLRDDVISEPNTLAARDHNQQSAPAVEQGLFLVPKVIE